ncbi:MAG: aldose epimerase family protein [Vicinamibacterales bacterium]
MTITRSTTRSCLLLATLLLGCGGSRVPIPAVTPFVSSYVPLKRENFQRVINGEPVDLYTISNRRGMVVRITNYGAKIEQIVVPDRDGRFGDVVLGYETLEGVQAGQPSMGAFMGRYAGRIAGGTFSLDGVPYTLSLNEAARNNTMHGGPMGARTRVFSANQLSPSRVQMTMVFRHAEDAQTSPVAVTGFPGTLSMQVTYSVTEQNELRLEYSATTDRKTVLNLTTHPFFNLSNTPGSSVFGHVISINADRVLEVNSLLRPTGVLRNVAGTPMDFRVAKPLGQDIATAYDQLRLIDPAGAYDHTYVVNSAPGGALTRVAMASEPTSGRTLEVWSTEPGVHLLSAPSLNGLAPRDVGKGGVAYPKSSGFCLEPMHFPDSPNQPAFPSTMLDAGATYRGEIVFRFGTQAR